MKLVHLLSCPDHEREQASIAYMSCYRTVMEYKQIINPPYSGEVPEYTGTVKHSILSTTYGCYLAHRNAFLNEFDTDFLFVCECDCILYMSILEFYEKLLLLTRLMRQHELALIAIGSTGDEHSTDVVSDELIFPESFIFTHSLLYNCREKEAVTPLFHGDWETPDILLSRIPRFKRAITKVRYTGQMNGYSLVRGFISGTCK